MKFKRHLTYSVVASSLALTAMTSSVSSNFATLNEVHAAPAVQASSQKTSAWAKPYVDAMNKAGLVPRSLTHADLTQKISREEFAELITLYVNKARMKNPPIPKQIKFTDTKNPMIQKAAELGLVEGVGNNKFDPTSKTNRQEIAVMTTRAASGVGTMYEQGAIEGMGNGRFAPKDSATREQAIKIISELAEKKGLVKINRNTQTPTQIGKLKVSGFRYSPITL